MSKNSEHFLCRKKPNLIVHLDVSPEESLRRIKMRNRECESSITLEYLQNLHSAYEAFIADIARMIPVIRVNYERFRTADEMADMIVRYDCPTLNVIWSFSYYLIMCFVCLVQGILQDVFHSLCGFQ